MSNRRTGSGTALAPWLNFFVPLAFSFLGLALWVVVGGWTGLLIFIACFIAGSMIGRSVFKRMASAEQIREDLEARLKND